MGDRVDWDSAKYEIHTLLCDAMFVYTEVHPDDAIHEVVKYVSDILFDIDIDDEPLEQIDPYELDLIAEDVENLAANMEAIELSHPMSKTLNDIYAAIMIIMRKYR